jgi:hypothetical protein
MCYVQHVHEHYGRSLGVQTVQQEIAASQDVAVPAHLLSHLSAGVSAANKQR